MDLLKLASLFRSLQLYTHMAHNLTKGQTFLQDHGQFSEIYSFAESSYDGLIERAIGLGNEANIVEVNEKYFRPAEVDILLGDYSKAKNILNWTPNTKFKDLVRIMLNNDIN